MEKPHRRPTFTFTCLVPGSGSAGKGPNRLGLTSDRRKQGRRQETERSCGMLGLYRPRTTQVASALMVPLNHVPARERCSALGLVIAPPVIHFHYYVSTHRRSEGTQPGRGASLLPRRRRERESERASERDDTLTQLELARLDTSPLSRAQNCH